MSLEQWLANGWLKRHQTSPQEIANLLAIARRDLNDSRRHELSDDWRFGIAYNAALKLCTILIFAEGFRPQQSLAHFRTLQGLTEVLGEDRRADAAYLDACRIKRNTVEYDCVGAATGGDADELIEFAESLMTDVIEWLRGAHPKLLASGAQ